MIDLGSYSFQSDDLATQALKASGNKPAPTDDLDKLVKRATSLEEAKANSPALKEQRAKQAKTLDEDTAASDKALGQVEPYKPPPPPEQKQTDPIQAFGSLGSVFGILASAFTHQPWQNAMNASAAAINAVKANDRAGYESAYKAWQDNTKLMLDRHKMQHEAYEDAREKSTDDIAAGELKYRLAAAQFDDPLTATMTEAGLVEKRDEIHEKRQRLALDMEEKLPEIHLKNALAQAKFDAYEAYQSHDQQKLTDALAKINILNTGTVTGKESGAGWELFNGPGGKMYRVNKTNGDVEPVNATGLTKIGPSGADAVPQTPEERESAAAQGATGEPLNQIIPGYGKDAVAARRQTRADAIKKIMDETGKSAGDAGVELANRTVAFQSGKKSEAQLTTMLGATKQAVAQLNFNIDKTKEEMAKLPSSNLLPIINAIARGEEKWTGDPAYSSLFYYMHATAVESARILSGAQSSAAQLHQGAMEEAQKWASINMTPASFNAVGDAMKEEGINRIETFEQAIKGQSIGGAPGAPAPGTIEDGHRFRGGNPADPKNREKIE